MHSKHRRRNLGVWLVFFLVLFPATPYASDMESKTRDLRYHLEHLDFLNKSHEWIRRQVFRADRMTIEELAKVMINESTLAKKFAQDNPAHRALVAGTILRKGKENLLVALPIFITGVKKGDVYSLQSLRCLEAIGKKASSGEVEALLFDVIHKTRFSGRQVGTLNIKSPHEDPRVAAIDALGAIGGGKAEDFLLANFQALSSFRDEENVYLARSTISALGRLESEKAVDLFEYQLPREINVGVIVEMYLALGEIPTNKSVTLLEEGLGFKVDSNRPEEIPVGAVGAAKGLARLAERKFLTKCPEGVNTAIRRVIRHSLYAKVGELARDGELSDEAEERYAQLIKDHPFLVSPSHRGQLHAMRESLVKLTKHMEINAIQPQAPKEFRTYFAQYEAEIGLSATSTSRTELLPLE